MTTSKHLSPRMLDMLKRLANAEKINWLGGIDGFAYYSGDLKSCTATFMGLRRRGFAEIVITSPHSNNGYITITTAGVAHLKEIA